MVNGFNLYMAGLSKAGNHANITLVSGDSKETRVFAHWTVRLGEARKVKAEVKGDKLLLEITLDPKTLPKEKPEEPKAPEDTDGIPF